jgi:UDP-N-acetylglucosamine--N-acetylmuramyl-(pentapeptide) pyrophosphoryl-undecaprenol N-acetylglucosamine transferase
LSTEDKNIRLLLTGGGTGGHLFPAVATAQEFQRQMPGTKVLFVGTKRKVDTRSLAAYGYQSENIRSFGLKGKSPWELLKAFSVMPLSCVQALIIVHRFKPDIILGVGGYVTAPVVAAGKCLKVPVVIHEQNSVPGLANRKLGKIADRVCLSLPGSGAVFPLDKITYTGNPVRSNILELAEKLSSPKKKEDGRKTLLVLGGSQGARAVNRLVAEALANFTDAELAGIKVIHQTGDNDLDYVREIYKKRGIEAEVQPFFMNMHEVYAQADLLVSRAGATTLSEVAVLGRPAIFIPYPFAADNHQEKNGEYYVQGGGGLQYIQKDLTAEQLGRTIMQLIRDDKKLEEMGKAMKSLSFPEAAERIVACCLEEIEKRGAK